MTPRWYRQSLEALTAEGLAWGDQQLREHYEEWSRNHLVLRVEPLPEGWETAVLAEDHCCGDLVLEPNDP